MLLERVVKETGGWFGVFARREAHQRAVEHLLASACTMGRRTVSRSIIALGRDHQDRSADYELYSERTDLHRNEIGALERGEKNISFINLLRVCVALGVTPADLLADLSLVSLRKLPPKRTRSGHREK